MLENAEMTHVPNISFECYSVIISEQNLHSVNRGWLLSLYFPIVFGLSCSGKEAFRLHSIAYDPFGVGKFV